MSLQAAAASAVCDSLYDWQNGRREKPVTLEKLPSIEVRPTALAWQDLDFDLWLWPSIACELWSRHNWHAKVQGQRSVGSEARVKTNGQTDRRRRLHYLPVGNKTRRCSRACSATSRSQDYCTVAWLRNHLKYSNSTTMRMYFVLFD